VLKRNGAPVFFVLCPNPGAAVEPELGPSLLRPRRASPFRRPRSRKRNRTERAQEVASPPYEGREAVPPFRPPPFLAASPKRGRKEKRKPEILETNPPELAHAVRSSHNEALCATAREFARRERTRPCLHQTPCVWALGGPSAISGGTQDSYAIPPALPLLPTPFSLSLPSFTPRGERRREMREREREASGDCKAKAPQPGSLPPSEGAPTATLNGQSTTTHTDAGRGGRPPPEATATQRDPAGLSKPRPLPHKRTREPTPTPQANRPTPCSPP
jgi:hypothetical protein